MPDWTKSMQRTFEYYIVDPTTWADTRRLTSITSSSISWDYSSDTVGSASFSLTEPIGETYIRTYLITVQNGIKERWRLGTFLAQSPSFSFNGKYRTETIDAYSPLIELKEKQPPLGYTVLKNSTIMPIVSQLTANNLRAYVVAVPSSTGVKTLDANYTANTSDTWFSYISGLLNKTNYKFDLDTYGRILFSPIQKTEAMTPRWTYSTDNSSILSPEISIDRDIYGIPNVIEVIQKVNGSVYIARAVNSDPLSPISTVTRGREIIKRITDANFGGGTPSTAQVDDYAKQALKSISTTAFKVSYSHAYCPVRIGDCVLINYPQVGLNNVKAKVVSQSIQCDTAMTVSETAEYSVNLLETSLIPRQEAKTSAYTPPTTLPGSRSISNDLGASPNIINSEER